MELKNKYEAKKESRKKTLSDYELHKKTYLRLERELNKGRDDF